MRRLLALVILALLLVSSRQIDARTWNVPSAGTPTIYAALDSANSVEGSDTVIVATGTYYGGGYLITSPDPLLFAGATGNPVDVILDGDGDQILEINEVAGVVVRAFTFKNGMTAGVQNTEWGGALNINSGPSDPLVENCVFENDSSATYGGAVGCTPYTRPTFRKCTFRGNGAYLAGGALCADPAAYVTLDSCLFEMNVATHGGGVYCSECTLSVSGTQFLNNQVGINGGGICASHARVELATSRFEENQADDLGGAIFAEGSTLEAVDPFFTQNVALESGGGVYLRDSGGALRWGNFSHNQALGSNGGGAIVLEGSTTTISTTEFVWNMSAGPGGAMVLRGPAMPDSIDACSFQGNQAVGTGGAVFVDGNGGDWNVDFLRCVFAGNSSTDGDAAASVCNSSPLLLARCTVVGNTPGGEYGAAVGCRDNGILSLDRSIVAFASSGGAVDCDTTSFVYVSCTDVYGNPGGDWVGCLAGLDSTYDNFSADPMFCGPGASPAHPYMLQEASPCNGHERCGLIGGEDVGCGFVKNWIGEGDGVNWEDPENWDPVGVPGPYDDVRLAQAGMEYVFLSSPATVFRLTVGGESSYPMLEIVSNTLEITHEGTNLRTIEIYEGGALSLSDGAALVNEPGATVRLEGGDLLGDGLFVNGGDVWKIDSELTSRIGVPFENRMDDPGDGALHVEEGTLIVSAPLSNSSTIRAYSSAAMILDPGDGPLRTDLITNHGLLVVESGASLVLQTPTTVFMNMGTGVVELQGGDIMGAGRFVNHGLVRKTDPALATRAFSHIAALFENAVGDPGDGAVRAEEGVLAIEEEFDNAGSLHVYTGAQVALDPGEGPLRADLLTNTGVVIVRSGGVLSIDPAGTVFWNTVSGQVRLQGTGELLGTGLLRNHGLFIKEDVAKSRAFGHVAVFLENEGNDPGDGAIQVDDGGLWVEGELTNTGTITIANGASLLLDPGEGPLRGFRSAEPGERTAGVLTNSVGGVCEIQGSLSVAPGGSFANYGLLTMGVGASVTNEGVFDLEENGVLAGSGTFDNTAGSFTGAGVIRPGLSAGILTFLGDFSQTATGEIEAEIGGTTPGTGYDRLSISGTAALDGALYTTLTGGFTPVEGDSFAVITIAGGLAGRTDFDCFSGLDVPGSLFLEPVQVPAAFSLVARDSSASNGPPVAGDDGDSTDAATPLLIRVLANDTDPEMNPLRVALVSTAGTTGLVVVLPGDSLIGYVPERSFSGRDSFTYTVTDCGGGADVATVTIGVARAPRAWVVPVDQPTITAGLAAAWAKDTVVVASGTYHEHDLVMKSGVLLRSETLDPASVVIDADSLGRVLSCSGMDGTTMVLGITFTGGNSTYGAGASVQNSSMTFDRCVFRENGVNGSTNGGGLFLSGGQPVVRRCLLERNRGQLGGALNITGSGSTALIESTLIGNNVVSNAGAAAYVQSGAHPTFRNCTIAGNACPTTGSGGFHVFGTVIQTVVELEHSILASNTSGPSSNVAHCATNAALHASCCDIYGNTGNTYAGCLSGQQTANGNFSADPRFCQFGNAGDPYSLMSGSPCAPANNPSCGLVGARPVGCGAVTGVEDAAPPAPAYRLFANRPNPFNPTTTIRFALPRAERATLVVYDVSGRRVAAIADGLFGPGEFDATWNGTDSAGRDVASGVYFARLVAGEFAAVRKMVLLR